jgi:hypothetical protein
VGHSEGEFAYRSSSPENFLPPVLHQESVRTTRHRLFMGRQGASVMRRRLFPLFSTLPHYMGKKGGRSSNVGCFWFQDKDLCAVFKVILAFISGIIIIKNIKINCETKVIL